MISSYGGRLVDSSRPVVDLRRCRLVCGDVDAFLRFGLLEIGEGIPSDRNSGDQNESLGCIVTRVITKNVAIIMSKSIYNNPSHIPNVNTQYAVSLQSTIVSKPL